MQKLSKKFLCAFFSERIQKLWLKIFLQKNIKIMAENL